MLGSYFVAAGLLSRVFGSWVSLFTLMFYSIIVLVRMDKGYMLVRTVVHLGEDNGGLVLLVSSMVPYFVQKCLEIIRVIV